jgi:hypothetical protein
VLELPKLGDLLQKAYSQNTAMALLSVEERGLVSRQMVKDAELRELKESMQELEVNLLRKNCIMCRYTYSI